MFCNFFDTVDLLRDIVVISVFLLQLIIKLLPVKLVFILVIVDQVV